MPNARCFTRWHYSPLRRQPIKRMRTKRKLPPSLSRCSKNIRSIPAFRIISFTHATIPKWQRAVWRQRAGIPKSRRPRHTRCTCPRTSTRAWGCGMNQSLPIWRHKRRRARKAIKARSCTRWIISFMPTCNSGAMPTLPASWMNCAQPQGSTGAISKLDTQPAQCRRATRSSAVSGTRRRNSSHSIGRFRKSWRSRFGRGASPLRATQNWTPPGRRSKN